MSRIHVMTILGTRPEIIRLSRVIPALDRHVEHTLVHTGQNYDYHLDEVFFRDLDLRPPDVRLSIDTTSLGSVLGGILKEIEVVLRDKMPDAVLVLGDTNSAISALMAKRMKIPVYHMEAGNRCFDPNVPEETNRRLVDHVSDFNLVYTEHARRHLLSEGLPHRRVYLTGSPMREVLEYYGDKIDASEALHTLGLEAGRYLIVSLHREENVDSRSRLTELMDMLSTVAGRFELPVVVSTHPRTRDRLNRFGLAEDADSKITLSPPFGFLDYVKLQKNAFCVLSDSGTIAEESAILGFPAIMVRRSMERPEALDCGSIVLTGLDADVITQAIEFVTDAQRLWTGDSVPREYTVRDVSTRVVALILGTCRLSNRWHGVELHDYN